MESEVARAEGADSLLNIDVMRQGKLLEKLEAEVRALHPQSKFSFCSAHPFRLAAITARRDRRAHIHEARKGRVHSRHLFAEALHTGAPQGGGLTLLALRMCPAGHVRAQRPARDVPGEGQAEARCSKARCTPPSSLPVHVSIRSVALSCHVPPFIDWLLVEELKHKQAARDRARSQLEDLRRRLNELLRRRQAGGLRQ